MQIKGVQQGQANVVFDTLNWILGQQNFYRNYIKCLYGRTVP